MKFKDVEGIEVVEMDVLDGKQFKVRAHDGIDEGQFLYPDFTVSRKMVVGDLDWKKTLEKCGVNLGPEGMIIYQRFNMQGEWSYLVQEKNYIEFKRGDYGHRN